MNAPSLPATEEHPTMTVADELRAAAKKIRDTVGAASAGPWRRDPRRPWGEALVISAAANVPTYVAGSTSDTDADHIALWNPAVAAHVAKILDDEVSRYEHETERDQAFMAGDAGGDMDPIVALARAINGTAA